MGNVLTNLHGTLLRVYTDLCSTGMCWTKPFAQTKPEIFWCSRLKLVFLNSKRDSNFICSTTCLKERHLLQKLLNQGPCCCPPPPRKAHAQRRAKGCFSRRGPTDTTYARVCKTNTTPWENMWQPSSSSICVLIYHVSLGHLHTVKANISTFPNAFTQVFFISSSV